MAKRTIAIKFDREKFRAKEINDIMNVIHKQIDDTIQIIPMFDGMKIYDVSVFEFNSGGTINFIEFKNMESMNKIIDAMIKIPLSSCEDFDEWQEKLP